LKKTGVIIQGFDILDVTKYIGQCNKKYQAILLSKIEDKVRDRDTFLQLRKDVLDSFNDYTRDIVESVFGNIEDA
jgi:hypothetical protein